MSIKSAVLITIGIIIISNFIPKIEIGKQYVFQNSNGDFKYYIIESKSGNVKDLELKFIMYSGNRKDNSFPDDKIYRTFKKEFYKFWRWREYLFLPRYKYPYKEFIEIEK